jgi:hypothetical protein
MTVSAAMFSTTNTLNQVKKLAPIKRNFKNTSISKQ